jgi:D-sedoheptulose 7-phosphate isomerase
METDATVVAEAAIRDCISVQERLLEREHLRTMIQAAGLLMSALSSGGKLLLFGNGGSASDAAHVAAEFVGRFQRERRPLPALSLASDQAAVTAIGNDYGFEQVFARQLQAFGQSVDVAIAFSTSGRSANVIAAVKEARRLGMGTIGLTGADGGELADAVDVCLRVPARSTARVQESHILVAHVLCELVERELT